MKGNTSNIYKISALRNNLHKAYEKLVIDSKVKYGKTQPTSQTIQTNKNYPDLENEVQMPGNPSAKRGSSTRTHNFDKMTHCTEE